MFARLPLTALRTFESAARLASFKSAAEELCVTPTAVSHQIRALEELLGVELFERRGRRVSLTGDGERLQRSLHGAFLEISRSLERFQPSSGDDSLSLTTTPAFAALWLIPRLGRFYRKHPQIRVRIETSNGLADLQRDASIDLAIRCGFEEFPQLLRFPLMSEHFSAYGTPHLLASLPEAKVELINVAWSTPQVGELPSWEDWNAAIGEDWVAHTTRRDYPDEHYALQAAISGQGLVLASSVLASDSLANGLLQPYRGDITLPGPQYRAVCVPGRERQAAVQAFLRWLEKEAAEG